MTCAAPCLPMPAVAPGWSVTGPFYKDENHYLSRDGDNPDAPWPGYGWPLDTVCWFYRLRGHGRRLCGTGSTVAAAAARTEELARKHARQSGAVR